MVAALWACSWIPKLTYVIEMLLRRVWIGSNPEDHLIPTPCCGLGHLPVDQVAQNSIQPGLKPTASLTGSELPVPGI